MIRKTGFLLAICSIFVCVAGVFGQETVKPTDTRIKNDQKQTTDTSRTNIATDAKSNDAEIARVSQNNDDKSNERYRIGFEDTIEVVVSRHEQLSGTVSVDSDGTISLPRLQKTIVAVCKTERELANDIADAYKVDYLRDPHVNVRVVDQKSQSFGVIGAVEKPGTYFINRRIRLLELLAFAGGPSEEAGQNLIVARSGSTSACSDNSAPSENAELELLQYKIKDITEGRDNLWLKPGDIISVLDADIIYVVGNVNKPKEIKLREPITLYQAISSAEGVKSTTDKENVRILRRKEDSFEREELVFNLKDIETQKVADPVLQPDDIVAVSKDKSKVIVKGIVDVFKSGVPSLFYRF